MSDWSVHYEKSAVEHYITDLEATLPPHKFKQQLRIWEKEKFIKSIKVLATKNYPGILKHTFYYCRNGKWKDEHRLPQILFELTVTNTKWISHWQEGDSWGTTAYGTGDHRILQGNEEEWRTFFKTFSDNPAKMNPLPEDVDKLIEGLKYENPSIVFRSADILGEMGGNAKKAVPELMKKIASGNLDIFGESAEALGKIGDERAIDVLLPSLACYLTRQSESVTATIAIGMIAPKNNICVDALLRIIKGCFVTYDHNQKGYVGVRASSKLKTAAAFALYKITGEEKYLKKWMKGLYGDYRSNGVVYKTLENASEELYQIVKPFTKKYLKSKHKNVEDWDTDFWNNLVGN